ncbi:inactive serine/threonine-protein kinase TEX14 isoform X1 [Salvelinus sp. IW2-2015]|uniref:inactive serine/threonine-protein kinase TEX14 isoform X1 n=1 Tax=Salvelinus sp. IW2-2015 TaxID=2691554 RepID=UPI000CDF6AB4|nr:inactive serine/threonine-protein kinase TEX14 isoform X1 [Salvelinus alpinus]XP_023823975.1 inactive serine/threonine-protein kinase TEX14 isoform X1 [Salvelinus alpinus]XP_023823976.1 inactive serine/threonine-protein kinase TEX14 isoform X1 [Salvelinus alpinus]
MAALPVPCPVRLGIVKNGGLPAQLHMYTLQKNLHKMEKLLKKGVDVDCVNHLGQTPLFCASLLGLASVTELLLQFGADPNHRCEDRSTPVHAAVFACNPWLLSGLLDAGGDLRLHDHKGRSPQDWAEAGAQEHSARMLKFLKSCVTHMHSLSQLPQPRELRRTPTSTSSKTLLRSPSLLELLKSGGSDLHLNRKITKSSACDTVQCFGFGKLCIDKPGYALGLLASLPVIGDSELGQADDEPLLSFSCGAFITMTNYSWKGCRITVKELQSISPQGGSQEAYLDLMLIELEYCNQLFHPYLLQLMAVSMSSDLLRVRLVFERVHVGSLHNLLHQRRAEFPVLRAETMLLVVLQVCEALLYLHGRALVLRALSSHSILLTHPGVAKLSGLGFMVPSDNSHCRPSAHLPLPPGLYNWAAPEVIRQRPCTGKADLYSLCALIQELYTDSVPWGPVDPRWIRQTVESGQALATDSSVPQPYYALVRVGLQPRPEDRTHSLQDLRYTLRQDMKEMSQVGGRRSGLYTDVGGGLRPAGWSPESAPVKEPADLRPTAYTDPQEGSLGSSMDTTVDREIQDQLNELDKLLDRENETERGEGEMTTDSEQPIFHRDISFRDILPLDDWRLCSVVPSEPYITQEEESDSSTVTEEEEEERTIMKERAVQPECPVSGKLSEHISSIVLNLKVSQVLLQQSECNLAAVETGRCRRQQARGAVDEVDGGAEGKDAQTPHISSSASTSLSSTLSGSVCSYMSRAVGPPSQYRLLPHGVHPSAKRLEAQLLKGGEARPISAEELAAWQREYPAEEYPNLECTTSEGTGSEGEEMSHYSSAPEDSFVNICPRRQQQAGRDRGSRGTVRGGQQAETKQQSVDRQELTDRLCLSSEGTESLEDSPRRPEIPAKAKWTSEVSELVARMTRGRLWVAVGPPASSDSEEMEDRQGFGRAVEPPRQDPLGRSDNGYRSSPDPASQPQKAAAEALESSSELEQIFKSFAGVQSESEEDADFHTVNRTFNMTCGVWEGSGQREEEGTSESDYTQSPVEPSSMFYTPNPEQRNNPSRDSQSPVSSEEDLDVTVEVCRGADSRTVPEEQTLETKHGKYQPVQESDEIDINPTVSQHAPFPMASGLPDLADVSSITCSPAQHHEWLGQERLQPSPLNRRPPPCYSTPRSPATAPNYRAMGVTGEPIPALPSLLDTSTWGSTRSLPPHTESFATASLGASTTDLSRQTSPLMRDSSLEETGTPVGVSEFTTASSGERQTTGTSQEGVGPTYTVPTTSQERLEERESLEEKNMEYLEGERGMSLAADRKEELEGSDQGSCAGVDVDLMDEDPLDASSSVLEEDELVSDEEELPGEEETDHEDEEVINDQVLTGEEGSVASTEQAETSGAHHGSTHSEDYLSGCGPDTEGAAAPVQQSQAKGLSGGPDSLEETDRAHSTLDEVLQGMLVERAAGHRVLKSPGLVAHPKQQLGVCEPQVEGELNEDAGCPGGDRAEVAERKGVDTDWTEPAPVAEKLEMASHETWSQPHRVIVLEQTPIKSQSDPNQVRKNM